MEGQGGRNMEGMEVGFIMKEREKPILHSLPLLLGSSTGLGKKIA